MNFPWTIETIGPDDIQAIVQDRWPEGLNLEYKSEAYPNTDAGLRELLRDVAAMANADGGYLFLGISEDDQGRALSITGVNSPAVECQRINQACIDSVVERIARFEVRAIQVEPGKHVLVLFVPQSNFKPHMIRRESRTEFWKRYGRDKRTMQFDEIRRDFTDYGYQQHFSRIEAQIGELQRYHTGPEYALLETERPVEKFMTKFIYSGAQITNLSIVSPFIDLAEGTKVSLKQMCERIDAEKIPTFVITTEPTEDYYKEGLELLKVNENIELRFNRFLHAKLFVAMTPEITDAFAMFGSGNLTTAAVRRNIELGMLVFGKGHGRNIVQRLHRWSSITLRTMSESKLIKRRTVARRD